MRIRFEMSGGLIGKSKTLDMRGQDFPEEVFSRIQDLIGESNFFEMPDIPLRNLPDAYVVMIQIEEEGRSRMIVCNRETAPPKLKELVQELAQYAAY